MKVEVTDALLAEILRKAKTTNLSERDPLYAATEEGRGYLNAGEFTICQMALPSEPYYVEFAAYIVVACNAAPALAEEVKRLREFEETDHTGKDLAIIAALTHEAAALRRKVNQALGERDEALREVKRLRSYDDEMRAVGVALAGQREHPADEGEAEAIERIVSERDEARADVKRLRGEIAKLTLGDDGRTRGLIAANEQLQRERDETRVNSIRHAKEAAAGLVEIADITRILGDSQRAVGEEIKNRDEAREEAGRVADLSAASICKMAGERDEAREELAKIRAGAAMLPSALSGLHPKVDDLPTPLP